MIGRPSQLSLDFGPSCLGVWLTREVEEAFWQRIDQSGRCWIWTGPRDQAGYGRLSVDGVSLRAHRAAYALAHRRDPGPLFVLHGCDNPPCCRTSHLYLGDHQANMDDMVRRKRQAKGEDIGSARLTEKLVIEIRIRARYGASEEELAELMGVSRKTIKNVIERRTWRHVPGLEDVA